MIEATTSREELVAWAQRVLLVANNGYPPEMNEHLGPVARGLLVLLQVEADLAVNGPAATLRGALREVLADYEGTIRQLAQSGFTTQGINYKNRERWALLAGL